MQTTKNSFKRRGATAWLNKVQYTGFLIGNLPKRFAFIYDANKEQDGITKWFNHKGWTFIQKDLLKTGW